MLGEKRESTGAVNRLRAAAASLLLVALVIAGLMFSRGSSAKSALPTTSTSSTTTTFVTTTEALSTTKAPEPTTTTLPPTTTTAPPQPPPTSDVTTTTSRPAPVLTGCASALPAQMASRNGASQVITVVAPYAASSYATLTAWKHSGSCWVVALGPLEARIGSAGISTDKHEGDDTTPAGIYNFESTMYGNAPNPGVHFAYQPLSCGDWWDEDSASPEYNQFVVVPCSDTDPPFDNGASEALWTETVAYPSFAVLDYNSHDIPGKGSAIFLHADIGTANTGCISIPLGDLDEVLDWMLPAGGPAIAIGTTSTITSY